MLDTVTKRRIDSARDILVGKVPDPKSQVEQITIALIYKFMDDMDAEAEELGGKRKFFTGDFARYGWAKLMSAGIGGHELIGLYSEGIATMPQNAGIPPLFRDIFKNAYLPYRDPETLKSFLKIIDEFSYDHSERLGDAYEYLLSVLGSQGDAGQFRTPRHIIDFMVEILAPQKHETMGDTACGTAGFLISAYKHVLKHNSSDYTPEHSVVNSDKDSPLELLAVDSPLHYKGDLLTPDERKRLAGNIKGYDISPDMVRMSLVNLYLHGFNDPHIVEYDTLTSEERWDENFDVIFANPPFMSPKGGIKPHKRFSIQAKRSEVLFVDYIAEHLTPTGRAGIIVPEGIIFQSQTAYKALRKMLVESSLLAVISLPAGVFQPYSGVKTSILILDKSLAKHSDSIAFFKIDNDGYGLGAQRRAVAGEQLSSVLAGLKDFVNYLNMDEQDLQDKSEKLGLVLDGLISQGTALIVAKEKIAGNGDYNLSGERYRVGTAKELYYPVVKLSELAENLDSRRVPITKGDRIPGAYPYYGASGIVDMVDGFIFDEDILLVSEDGANLLARSTPIAFSVSGKCWINNHAHVLRFQNLATQKLIELYLNSISIEQYVTGAAQPKLNQQALNNIQISMPPLDIQKEIVAEIEGYQKVINGASAVLDNYRPHIPIHPDWPIYELSEVTTKITDGAHFTPTYLDSGVPFLRVTDITGSNASKKFIPEEEHNELIKRCRPEKGDVLYSKNGTIGIAKLINWDWEFSIFVSLALIKPKKDLLDSHYLECFLNSDTAYAQATARSKSGTVTNLHLVDIKTITIPLPSLLIQQSIVAEIEAEQALVAANRELITRFEKKIQATLARVWGEEPNQENTSD